MGDDKLPLYSSISSINLVKGDLPPSLSSGLSSLSYSAIFLAVSSFGSCLLASFCTLTGGTGGGGGALGDFVSRVLCGLTPLVGATGGGLLGFMDLLYIEKRINHVKHPIKKQKNEQTD